MAIEKTKKTKHPGVYRLPDNKWFIRAAVKMPDGTVKQLKKVLDAGTPERDVLAALADLKDVVRGATPPTAPAPAVTLTPLPTATNLTVEAYAKSWLAVRSRRLKPSAAVTYEIALSKHILPRLGHLPCDQVTRAAVESWVVWEEGRVDAKGEPLKEPSMRQHWRVLKTLLADMSADRNLPNPVTRVRPPERPQGDFVREQATLTVAQMQALLDAARVDYPDRYAEILTLALTGMRAGEVYALKWDAVDYDKQVVVVKRSVSAGKITETTKTKSHRHVPIHPMLATALQDQFALLAKKGHPGLATGLCFPSDVGTPRTPHTLDRPLANLAGTIGLDVRLGAQVLRRSLNSNLLRLMVDRLTIRSIMGHTTEAMTQRYFGVNPEDKAAAVLALTGAPPTALEAPAADIN